VPKVFLTAKNYRSKIGAWVVARKTHGLRGIHLFTMSKNVVLEASYRL